jgi:hypothetical protein
MRDRQPETASSGREVLYAGELPLAHASDDAEAASQSLLRVLAPASPVVGRTSQRHDRMFWRVATRSSSVGMCSVWAVDWS